MESYLLMGNNGTERQQPNYEVISLRNTYSNLFNASLRDNITLFNSENIQDRQIHEAAAITGLDELIKIMPGGLDYVIKDGASNISGGQKQLVELRALLRKPKWLLRMKPQLRWMQQVKSDC